MIVSWPGDPNQSHAVIGSPGPAWPGRRPKA